MYPEEVLSDERYGLFLKLVRDRENVDNLVAEAVKLLKVRKSIMHECIEGKEYNVCANVYTPFLFE